MIGLLSASGVVGVEFSPACGLFDEFCVAVDVFWCCEVCEVGSWLRISELKRQQCESAVFGELFRGVGEFQLAFDGCLGLLAGADDRGEYGG